MDKEDLKFPADVPGWLETRWGMDQTFVALLGLHKPTYEIGSRTQFSVELTFTKTYRPYRSRLSLVRLKDEYEVTTRDVSSVREVLNERFGKPARSGTSDTMFWRFPTTTVSMWHLVGRDGLIVIDFQPTATFQQVASAF